MIFLNRIKAIFSKPKQDSIGELDDYTKFVSTNINYALKLLLHQQLAKNFTDIQFSINDYTIVTNNGLTIYGEVVSKTQHPNALVMQINFRTTHETYFKGGAEEMLAGFGESDLSALEHGVGSFLTGQFPAVLRALTAEQNPEVDFMAKGRNGEEEKWHTIIGSLQVQGKWRDKLDELQIESFFELYSSFLEDEFIKNKSMFHWVRAYIAKNPDGSIIGDCYFDNNPWPAGLEALQRYTDSWDLGESFAGMKQFIMFRKCVNHC